MLSNVDIGALCRRLGYHFKDSALLEEALVHRSFRAEKNNERLEYLGDAALNFVIAAALFHQNTLAREGELSRWRAHLVRGDTLTRLAQEFELGRYLRLGAGELKAGGTQRKSILADGLEAIVGAIYLDGGFEVCSQCILRWYAGWLENLETLPDLKDSKTRLQEYLQARRLPLPVYTILALAGPAHQQLFQVECQVSGLPYNAVGTGSSRRRAEQAAAEKILLMLNPRME